MTDQQPPLRAHEYILKEVLKTEQEFASNMAFLASLKPVIKAYGAGKELKGEAANHQENILTYLGSIEAIQNSVQEVQSLFAQAADMAKKIEKGEISPQEIRAHQEKLNAALDAHIENIQKSVYLFKKFNLQHELNPIQNPLPLNKFIEEKIIQGQNEGRTTHNNMSILAVMPVQRIPRYALLAADLEKHLENIPHLEAEHVVMSSEKAARAANVTNELTRKAEQENRIIAFKKIIEAKIPNSKGDLLKAEEGLKEFIDGGVSLKQELDLNKQGIRLGDLAAKLGQGKKREIVQLQAPKAHQTGEVAANVISGYIKAGFAIQFDDSIHATKLWQDTLKAEMPDDKTAPIVIDLPPELLKNSAMLRQTVKTAAMLQEQGFDVQSTPRFKAALKENQEKSYGFFNVVARIRQFNFKTDSLQFANTVPTFKPTPPPRPKTVLPLLSVNNLEEVEREKQTQREANHEAVMMPPKKEFLASPRAPNKQNKTFYPGKHQRVEKKHSEDKLVVKRLRND